MLQVGEFIPRPSTPSKTWIPAHNKITFSANRSVYMTTIARVPKQLAAFSDSALPKSPHLQLMVRSKARRQQENAG